MKSALDELIRRLDTAQGGISELEDFSKEISKTKRKEKKDQKGKKTKTKTTTTSKDRNNYKRYNMHVMGILEGEERNEQKKYLKKIMLEKFLEFVSNTKPEIQEAVPKNKQNECPKNYTYTYHF